jgi:hypothetical protein
MQKLMITLTTSALVLGSAVWVVKATPLTGSAGISSQDYSPIEKIGCAKAGDNCPYGYRIERHGGGKWSCEPCWQGQQGSKYWQGDRDYEPRRYQQYGDENYEPRRYQQYDDRDYEEPRRYRDY